MLAPRHLPVLAQGPAFDAELLRRGLGPLTRAAATTLQLNLGRLCNQACHHCHVEAGPTRTESMPRAVAERVVRVLADNPTLDTLDLTGGAPELSPHFRWLVSAARELGRKVIDRCNLTVLSEPGMADLATFLAAHEVEVVASLPCYSQANTDAQRGRGVFERSIAALQQLNQLGYGQPGSRLVLHLVYNPGGASLPPAQPALEARYKHELARDFGIVFHRLYTLTNLPIRRFAAELERRGQHDAYLALLQGAFNPATVPGLMCRSLISVGWTGALHDCDFNQMLELGLGAGVRTIFDLGRVDALTGAPITTASHCFGCSAGAGSSCQGALT